MSNAASQRQLRHQSLAALAVALALTTAVALVAKENDSTQQAKVQIERLHQQDIEATLSDKADELAKLWDAEAVRIQPGGPAEVGKATELVDRHEIVDAVG